MRMLRTVLFGAVATTGASLASLPAQADAGFYIGPDGARVYYDDDSDYAYDREYRGCYSDVWYTWRRGERTRVVDRFCYDRWGRRHLVDRDYYPTYRW